jgi:hypothetical protein
MIEIILEDLNDKSVMATNINIEKLYTIYKSGYLIGKQQRDGASKNAKKNLPEICFSRSEYLPQKTGIIPTQNLRPGQLIKITLNLDNVLNFIDPQSGKGIKKPYPVSYGNANKEKAGDTELRGEERIQCRRIPADKKYMTINIPETLFRKIFDHTNFGIKNRNANIENFLNSKEDKKEFLDWIETKKRTGLIKVYKDTSRERYYRNIKEDSYFSY